MGNDGSGIVAGTIDRPDNFVLPFQLDATKLKGRIVRLGSVLDDVLDKHDYPEPVSHLLGEAITLSLLLSEMLKFDGTFSLQTKGDGVVSMLVADVTSDGEVRAFASYDEDELKSFCEKDDASTCEITESADNRLARLMGKGYIAFTVDQGKAEDRYQGIFELSGNSMVDCVQQYFTNTEHIGTGIKMALGHRDEGWRSSAIMVQRLPEEDPGHFAAPKNSNLFEDDWRRTMMMLESCTEEEMLSGDLCSDELLYRLFNEDGVRVYPHQHVKHGCRCSRERVEKILSTMDRSELEDFKVNGKVVMKCEFCGTDYNFDDHDLDKIFSKKEDA